MRNINLYDLKLISRLTEVEKYFTKKEYVEIVELARELFEQGKFDLCEKELEKLPTDAELLGKLVEKLKGKSVAKTLRQMREGKIGNDLLTLKGLLSLGTHIVIECEHGNAEYGILLPKLLEKISEIAYRI